MSIDTRPLSSSGGNALSDSPHASAVIATWVRRCGRPIAILGWVAVVALLFWCASHIIRALLILLIASLLAFAITPLVSRLTRFMPRLLAILIVYLLVLTTISLFIYIIVITAIHQGTSLAQHAQALLSGGAQDQLHQLEQPLINLGIPANQLAAIPQQIASRIGGAAGSAVPFLVSFFDVLLDVILIAVLSIYLLTNGSRAIHWLRTGLPLSAQQRANFLIDTLQGVVGGYIRGQFLLAVLIGVLVGGGMTLFHVPYAILLGVLAFLLEFIPVLGTLISALICLLLALTQGIWIVLGVLVYFIVIHILEGDVIGPRIVGKAVGLNPVVSLLALVAGAELFGIWGALFASPLAGVVQALLVSLWKEWRTQHPEQFPGQQQVAHQLEQHAAAGESPSSPA